MMRSTGIIRKIDELGRIVIPNELRKEIDINLKEEVEIFIDEDKIILRKYTPSMTCALTGKVTKENKILVGGKIVLSPEGAELLAKEIEGNFVINN